MAEKYAYTPVPDTGNPVLERYLAEQLRELQTPILSAVDSAYGGMGIITPQTSTRGTTPVVIDNWDVERPDVNQNRMVVDTAAGTIQALEEGAYFITFASSIEITSGRAYAARIYLNDQLTNVAAVVDASNQSNATQLVINVLYRMQRGDVIEIRANSDLSGSQFDILSAEFSAFRVSEAL